MIIVIVIILVIATLITIGAVKLIDKFVPSKAKPFILIGLWCIIGLLAYQTYMSVYESTLFNKEKEKRYSKVIDRLIDIRDSQLAHRQVTGEFSNKFEDLIMFVDTAQFTITQRRDTTILDKIRTEQFDGVEFYKDSVVIDTLGLVSVKDSLFKTSNRYKTMMNVGLGKEGSKFALKAGVLAQNDIDIPVFEASVKKKVILYDQPHDLVVQENQARSVEEVNGDVLKVGSMDEINTNGNWPKVYGKDE